jgi:hypothetical protein
MITTPVKQTAEVVNGCIHVQLPKGFQAKRVTLTIEPLEESSPKLTEFQQFLLDSPEMSDEEYQAIQEKRQHLEQWK